MLSTMLRASDKLDVYSTEEIRRVKNAIGQAVHERGITAAIPDAALGLERLTLALANVERTRDTAPR